MPLKCKLDMGYVPQKSPLDLAGDKEKIKAVLRSSSYLHRVNNLVNEENGSSLPELQMASSTPEVYQSSLSIGVHKGG